MRYMIYGSLQTNNIFFFQHFFEIKIDGARNWRIENTNPKTFTNVNVWAAKASHGFPPADAYIENLEHENIGCILYFISCTICYNE